jgi:orotidine-5'-phosphate decarboxylase
MKHSKDYIIFPLDVPSIKEAKQYVKLLSAYVGMFKVGLELYIKSGPEIINFIKSSGTGRIFLDLKLNDIPATVARAVASIADLGIAFTTVHCGETKKMLEAAVSGSQAKVGILGVTVLTSVSSKELYEAGFRSEFSSDVSQLVMKKAAMAKEAGCAGVVCSGHEVKMIKQAFGKDFVVVTPGIRPAWYSAAEDDQKRLTTPARAVENGTDYLVIGRPIRDARDPQEAAQRIAKEIEVTLSGCLGCRM